MIDTVKVQSPPLDSQTFEYLRERLDFTTKLISETDHYGEKKHVPVYEISSGLIPGSFDHNVNCKLNYETSSLVIQGSVHKAMMGHNVFGGPQDIITAVKWLVADLSSRLQCNFPNAEEWRLCEVHMADVFYLEDAKSIPVLVSILAKTSYARRKPDVRGNQSATWRGVNSTIKFYHKGPEFRVHDAKRLNLWKPEIEPENENEEKELKEVFQLFLDLGEELYLGQTGRTFSDEERLEAERFIPEILANSNLDPVMELAKLADHIIRVEVEIKSKQLREWYGAKSTLLDVNQAQIEAEFWRQVEKITLEGKSEMEIVMTAIDVKARLEEMYGRRMGSLLFGTYCQLSVLDEKLVSSAMERTTFYRHKKKILEAGIDWRNSTISEGESIIPKDFSFRKDSPYRLTGESPEVQKLLAPYRVA